MTAHATTHLRHELHAILSNLQSEFSQDGSQGVQLRAERVHVAEISAMYLLYQFCREALLGEICQEGSHWFLDMGRIRDERDAARLTARDIIDHREQAEAELQAQPRVLLQQLQETIGNEEACTNSVQDASERLGAQAERGLLSCAREMTDLLLSALVAANVPYMTAPEQVHLATRTDLRLQDIVRTWLKWHAELLSADQGLVPLNRHAGIDLGDPAIVAVGTCVRRVMHLRRQQARLLCVLARLEAAERVLQLIGALRAKVILL